MVPLTLFFFNLLLLLTRTSYPKNLACVLLCVISVFSSLSSIFNVSEIKSDSFFLIASQSALLLFTLIKNRQRNGHISFSYRSAICTVFVPIALEVFFFGKQSRFFFFVCGVHGCLDLTTLFLDAIVFCGAHLLSRRIEFFGCFHHKFIQLMQINVGEKRRHNPTLRCAAVCGMIFPIFHISCFQKFVNELNKPCVLDFFSDHTDQYMMIYVVEAAFNIPFDKPACATKFSLDTLQRSMTASVRAESV